MSRMRITPVLLALLLAGCGGGDGVVSVPPNEHHNEIGVGQPRTAVRWETLVGGTQTGITSPRNVVIKDQASWAQLWSEHTLMRMPPTPLPPEVDFSTKMVVGRFHGWSKLGCGTTGITGVYTTAGKLVVDYEERLAPPGIVCTAEAKAPMQLVVVDRTDAQVEFVGRQVQGVWAPVLHTTRRAKVQQERQVVVKDEAAWAQLWEETIDNEAARPAVDFSKQMVVGFFLGTRPDSCYGTHVSSVVTGGGKLTFRYVETLPAPGAVCLMALTSPGQWVTVERSEAPVEFVKEYARYPVQR